MPEGMLAQDRRRVQDDFRRKLAGRPPCRAGGGRGAAASDAPARCQRLRRYEHEDSPMSVADKTLLLCDCNRTMPLDAPRWRGARACRPAPRVHAMMCQRELAAFAAAARGDLVVACTQEARLFGDLAEEGGARAGDPLRQHPRDRRLVRRGARRDAEDRRAARRGGAARARAGAERELRVRRPAADHRSARRGAGLGGGAARAPARVNVLADGRHDGAELPAERALPV